MGAADVLPPGPWTTRVFAGDTAEPTTVVMAGERAVCVVTAPNSPAVAALIARLPELLANAEASREGDRLTALFARTHEKQ